MKKTNLLLLYFSLYVTMQSCNEKKLTEVVEVPLPSVVKDEIIIGNPDDIKAEKGAFELLKLPYSYDALVPNIDAVTMELHYSKHYLAYTNALNAVLVGTELEQLPIETILTKLDFNNTVLRNNAGGYYNHTIYFDNMAPKAVGLPKDTLSAAIDNDFGSFEIFKNQFSNAANKQFGSGWAWLIVDKTGKLQITTTANQDNPLMINAIIKGKPILAIDVWEHAYYLNYKEKRKKYVDAFFNVINWKKVSEKYVEAIKK